MSYKDMILVGGALSPLVVGWTLILLAQVMPKVPDPVFCGMAVTSALLFSVAVVASMCCAAALFDRHQSVDR